MGIFEGRSCKTGILLLCRWIEKLEISKNNEYKADNALLSYKYPNTPVNGFSFILLCCSIGNNKAHIKQIDKT